MKTVQMGPISKFKQRATHLALGLGLAATLAFGAVMPALADEGTGSVSLAAGTSSATYVDPTFDFSAATVGGGATVSPAITIVDATGANAGWNVVLIATDFTGAGGTFPAVPRVSDAALDGTAVNDTSYLTDIPVNGGGGIIAHGTAATTSRGTHTLTPVIDITIPNTVSTGSYSATFTVSLDTTP